MPVTVASFCDACLDVPKAGHCCMRAALCSSAADATTGCPASTCAISHPPAHPTSKPLLSGPFNLLPRLSPQATADGDSFPAAPPVSLPITAIVPEEPSTEDVIGTMPDTVSSTPLPPIPPSPFDTVCPETDAPYKVDGWPGSPFRVIPFQQVFSNPREKSFNRRLTACRDGGSHCMRAYEFNVVDFRAPLFNEIAPYCADRDAQTWLLGYDGVTPGPTVKVPT
jgi:hypothetical protein